MVHTPWSTKVEDHVVDLCRTTDEHISGAGRVDRIRRVGGVTAHHRGLAGVADPGPARPSDRTSHASASSRMLGVPRGVELRRQPTASERDRGTRAQRLWRRVRWRHGGGGDAWGGGRPGAEDLRAHPVRGQSGRDERAGDISYECVGATDVGAGVSREVDARELRRSDVPGVREVDVEVIVGVGTAVEDAEMTVGQANQLLAHFLREGVFGSVPSPVQPRHFPGRVFVGQ